MSFKFPHKKWNFKCSPFKFLILAIGAQFFILFGALYLFQNVEFNEVDGQKMSMAIIYIRMFSISIAFSSFCWLIIKAVDLKYGELVRENKHIFMSICIVICLTFLLYAFIITLAIEGTPLNGYFLVLNSFTFFIISLALIVDIIRPDKNMIPENIETDRASISVSDNYQNVQILKYSRNNEPEFSEYGKEKNRRVSFANENSEKSRAESFHLIKWANQLENLNTADQFKIQQIIREMRLRARVFNSSRQSEQLFTEFSAANFYNNGKVVEEDPSS